MLRKAKYGKPILGRVSAPKGALIPKKPRTPRGILSSKPYPTTPRELAGKWVAWSRDRQIVASGDTLAGVVATVASLHIEDASYERVPRFDRPRVR